MNGKLSTYIIIAVATFAVIAFFWRYMGLS